MRKSKVVIIIDRYLYIGEKNVFEYRIFQSYLVGTECICLILKFDPMYANLNARLKLQVHEIIRLAY